MPTKVAHKEDISEWSTIFPNKVDTKNNSCIFMKKLFAISFSNILYLRQIFPDRAFRDKMVDGMLLKILQNEVEYPPASRLITWARGCFDALEKGYLKTVIIGIHSDSDDLETAIESYSFRFTYATADNSSHNTPLGMNISTEGKTGHKTLMKKHSFENIKGAALSVLRTLILASKTMGELPGNVAISMKLLYFDDITPPDYEPPGFRPADYSSYRYISETMSLLVGNVNTGFHNLELKMRTDKETFQKQMTALTKDMKPSPREQKRGANVSQDSSSRPTPASVSLTGLDKDEEGEENEKLMFGGGASAPLEINTPITSTVATPGFSGQDNAAYSQVHADENSVIIGKDEDEVRCPCRFSGDDGVMIVCDNCRKWQHSICFRIIEYDNIPSTHLCDICAENNNDLLEIGQTDDKLLGMKESEKMRSCNYRRLLIMCRNIGHDMTLTQNDISGHLGAKLGVVKELMSRLINKQVLVPTKNASGRRRNAKTAEWKVNGQELEVEIAETFCQKKKKSISIHMNERHDEDSEMDYSDDEVRQDVHQLIKSVKHASIGQAVDEEKENDTMKKNKLRTKRGSRKGAQEAHCETEDKVKTQHRLISKKRKGVQISPLEAKKFKASVSSTPQRCLH